jgi:Alpha-2,8-polysialyltransferase (POLYST)
VSATNPPLESQSGFDNLYVCYTAQNYLKALFLAHDRARNGERSKILGLLARGAVIRSFFETAAVDWVEVEPMIHDHRYVRILPSDRRSPVRLALRIGEKARLKLARWRRARAERERLLAEARRARRVFLFLERSYFSNFLLRHVRCELVEEGSSTYAPIQRPLAERVRGPRAKRLFHPGEHANIDRVWLRRPELAGPGVEHKVGPLCLDYRRLPASVRAVMQRIFPLEHPTGSERCAIVVSQAWCWSAIDPERVYALYAEVVSRLRERGFSVWFKPHPAEDQQVYARLGCRMMNPRIPLDSLELLGRDAIFDCAFSLLASSIETAVHLARRVVTVFDARVVVERLRERDFEQARDVGLANLDAVLAEFGASEVAPDSAGADGPRGLSATGE